MLASPLLHQKSKQQRELRNLAAEKGLRRKGSQGKTHKPLPRSSSLATPAPEVKHIKKVIPFVSWLLPFPFPPCDIPSIVQKASVKRFFSYKGTYILLTGTVPSDMPAPGKPTGAFPLCMTKVGRSLPREGLSRWPAGATSNTNPFPGELASRDLLSAKPFAVATCCHWSLITPFITQKQLIHAINHILTCKTSGVSFCSSEIV